MNPFEIIVQRKLGDTWPVVVQYTAPSGGLPQRVEGQFLLNQAELLGQTSPRGYGTVLGKALFQDSVRDCFVQAKAQSREPLHMLLHVEDRDLQTLRWERLCAPINGTWDLLRLQQDLPFSLYLPSATDRRFPPFGRRDLRALIIAANPANLDQYGLAAFDVPSTVASVQTALGTIPSTVLATGGLGVGPPTLDALCEQLTAQRYTLLHLICHGRVLNGTSVLYLTNAEGLVAPVAGASLLERLGRLQSGQGLPHFAFLATCESATPDASGALGGLAQLLVRELGMPAVLAMTEQVSLMTAQALATGFYQRLRQHGQADLALAEATAGLAERRDIVVPALFSRLAGQSLFSDTADRELTNAEIAFGLDRLEQFLPERAPVLRSQFAALAERLRGFLTTEAASLPPATRQERADLLNHVAELCQEALDLSWSALALGEEPPAYERACPFPGLAAFNGDQRRFFFGRKAIVDRLQEMLHNFPLLGVLGTSGSGKSSVVLAGLIPALQDREPGLVMAYLRPGSAPLAQLEAALQPAAGQPTILVVDQFEELFTLCTDAEEQARFVARLLELKERYRTVLTMRADFWGECSQYPALAELLQAHQWLLAPLDAVELRQSIEQQADAARLRFEGGLTETIIDDVQGEPGAMPLLQHALQQLWERRHGRWLRAVEYRNLGGVQRAIAATADAVYDALAAPQQEQVRGIFLRLTRLDDDRGTGGTRRDTRRRAALEDVVPADGSLEGTRALVQRLSDARLLVTSENPSTHEQQVEAVHEALIRHWPRLQGWLDEDRVALRLRDSISAAAAEWQSHSQDESFLVHRGSRLDDAEALLQSPRVSLNALEVGYVNACVALRQRDQEEAEAERQRELIAARQLAEAAEARSRAEAEARRQATRMVRSLSGAAVVLIALLGVAVYLGLYARDEAQKATREKRVALARQVAAQARSVRGQQMDLSLLLSAEAMRLGQEVGSTAEQWGLLSALGESPRQVAYLRGHDGPVRAVAVSPRFGHLVSADVRGNLIFWRWAASEGIQRVPTGYQGQIMSLAFRPDDQFFAAGTDDGAILFWDMSNPEMHPPTTLGRHEMDASEQRGVAKLAFSPDGAMLASGGTDGRVRLWSFDDRKLIGTVGQPDCPGDEGPGVTGLAFLPPTGMDAWKDSPVGDPSRLLAVGSCRTVTLWNVEQRTAVHSFVHQGAVTALAISPDGLALATAIWSDQHVGILSLWDLKDGTKPWYQHQAHDSYILSLAFNARAQRMLDGRSFYTLASGAADALVRFWQVMPRDKAVDRLHETLRGHAGWVWSLAFQNSGQQALLLASGGEDGVVIVWDAQVGPRTAGSLVTDQGVESIAFRRGNGLLYGCGPRLGVCEATLGGAGSPGDLVTRSGRSDHWPPRQEAPTTLAGKIAVSPDGQTEAISFGKEIWLRSATNPHDVRVLRCRNAGDQRCHTDNVTGLAFSRDGRILVSGSLDQTVIRWDVATGEPLSDPLRGHTGAVRSIAISPTKPLVASASSDKTIRLWDLETGASVGTPLRGNFWDVWTVAFHPDGSKLAAAGMDSRIFLWDLSGPQPQATVFPLPANAGGVWIIAFSPDGTLLASGGEDRSIILWDVGTGLPVGTPLWGHAGPVWSLAFSPDGRLLASGGADSDQTIVLWNINPEKWLNRACDVVRRNLRRNEWRSFFGDEPYHKTCPQWPDMFAPSETAAAGSGQ